jgi:hypothetical protein
MHNSAYEAVYVSGDSPGEYPGTPPGSHPEHTRNTPGHAPEVTRNTPAHTPERPSTSKASTPRSPGLSVELTVVQVAHILECDASTVRRMTARGQLRCQRTTPKGHRRYRLDDVLSALRNRDYVAGKARSDD